MIQESQVIVPVEIDQEKRDSRQKDLIPPSKRDNYACIVIGTGAVGRQVALQLAAVGVRHITLVDDDVVGVENLAPQGFMVNDVGRNKVEAIRDVMMQMNPDVLVDTFAAKFNNQMFTRFQDSAAENERHTAVFCCVDSIETRGQIWRAVKDRCHFFADARMVSEAIRVLVSDHPSTDADYPRTLFSQAEAYRGACTAKATIYTANIAGALLVGAWAKHLRGMDPVKDFTFDMFAVELTVNTSS